MKNVCLLGFGLLVVAAGPVLGKTGELRIEPEGSNVWIQVIGSPKVDWRIEQSTNLINWSVVPGPGAVASGAATNAPWRPLGAFNPPQVYFRGIETDGLYDTTLLRTISLTFTQANLYNLLVQARTLGTNVFCSLLTLDNGATNADVGARFRGNTSFTGLGGSGAPIKKSIAIDMDLTDPDADLMGYDNLNLNNAYLDYTLMRETIYFNTMRQFAVCPRCCLAQLYINGTNWGVYSCAQQQDGSLIKEYFPSNEGTRWRAPNMGGGMPPGGGTTSTKSALSFLGTNISSYRSVYELKTVYTNAVDSTNAWLNLVNACYVLNNTPAGTFRDTIEEVLAVDRWLWFLVLENVFTDEDSYYYKGADYMFYYEPESGRIHPMEHDGNESSMTTDYLLSPISGSTDPNRPVLQKLLSNAELRQRYLAHMRTVLEEAFQPSKLVPFIEQQSALSVDAIAADPKKGFTMQAYTNSVLSLKQFVTNRYNFLMASPYLTPVPPVIAAVAPPVNVTAADAPFVTAEVSGAGGYGIQSVWLYHRPKAYGKFARVQMLDDGAHGDGGSGDGIFGGAADHYPAGTKVRFYVEARSDNSAQAASFSPSRAEEVTYTYRVAVTTASNTPVVINEVMASNTGTIADPQGEFDDWIELRNLTGEIADLTGHYLSDEPNNPRKWQFPEGTTIPANGYLLIWADEDSSLTSATNGLHTSFKLSAAGEALFLTDTDANLNAILDSVEFGAQQPDWSYGRTVEDATEWENLRPTPGAANP